MTVSELIAHLQELDLPCADVKMEINITDDHGNGSSCADIEEVTVEKESVQGVISSYINLYAHLSL